MLNLRKATLITTFLFVPNLVEAMTAVNEGYIAIQNNTSTANYHSIYLINTNEEHASTIQFPFQNQSSWVFSGLPSGHYRVELVNDAKRNELMEFQVEHYSFTKASALFLLGLGMFGSLIWRLFSLDHKSRSDT